MLYLVLVCLSSFVSFGLSWPQKEQEKCVEGFGALANFCGVYEGLATKELDRQEKCSLLKEGEIFLKVLNTREVRIYFGEAKNYHKVGRIPLNSPSFKLDASRRDCSPLKGILSPDSGCKILNLEGSFSYSGGRQGFTGSYKIFDEGTLNSCRYLLKLNKEF